ncbi:hypothetical protein [Enterovibrio calviensis]|uniref:hypothetical protein n=1 Tax=Enterovibrio calviensis TaxID=91359 RepID=UPI003735EB8B
MMDTTILTREQASSTADYLLSGFDLVKNENRNRALVGKPYQKKVNSESFIDITYIENMLDFVDKCRLKGAADASFAGLFDSNGKIEFTSAKNINSLTSSLLIRATHISGRRYANEYAFKDECKPENIKDLADFKRVYGDSFVSSFSTGGDYWLMITFKSNSLQEKMTVDANIAGHGSIGAGKIGGEGAASLLNSIMQTNVQFDSKCKIRGLKNPSYPDGLEAQIKYADEFLSKTLDSPIIGHIKTKGYEEVETSKVFNTMAENREKLTGIGGLAEKLYRIKRLTKAINTIHAAHERYRAAIEDPCIADIEALAEIERNKILAQFIQYDRDPNKKVEELTLHSLDKGLPDIHLTVRQTEKFGGNGGGPLQPDINSMKEFLRECKHHLPRLIALKLHAGKPGGFLNLDATNVYGVCKIEAEFEAMQRIADESTQIDNTFQKRQYKCVVHGSNEGQDSVAMSIELPEDEINEIHIRSGIIVDCLNFVRKDNINIQAGQSDGGGPHSIHLERNEFLAGFESKSGSLIDAISFFIAGIKGITWKKF